MTAIGRVEQVCADPWGAPSYLFSWQARLEPAWRETGARLIFIFILLLLWLLAPVAILAVNYNANS